MSAPGCIRGEERPLPAESVVELVRARAASDPRATALEYRGERVTYEELMRRAGALAAGLAARGIGAGDRVAIWADRTPAVVVAALGTMQARAAYVPVDPTYPPERVSAIVDAASPVALLHDPASASSPPAGALAIDELTHGGSVVPQDVPRGEDAAYVVFTSGSTGAAKGVVVEHHSLVNYVCWCASLVGAVGGGAPLFASLGFDHAVTCLWVPLAQGRSVVLVPGLWEHDAIFAPSYGRHTFLKITPSHVRFFERLVAPDYGAATALVMFGGEALDPQLVARLAPRLGGARLVNHYGPTEATVGCCWHEFTAADVAELPSVPIGRPVWNSRAYVVDDDLRALPPGEPGELVVAGACVARGYLGGEPGGFVDEAEIVRGASGPAYRTGDVVERLPGGALLYRGRNDNQVKISGHRIELDELRRHALEVPGVAEVAFDVRRDAAIDAVEAFVVPSGDGAAVAALVREAIARNLPEAVVPRTVHVIDELLFDAHGKCDLAATRRRAGRSR
jgi:D-alanine--poly(phosphoribitol) ligase subunit 1